MKRKIFKLVFHSLLVAWWFAAGLISSVKGMDIFSALCGLFFCYELFFVIKTVESI